IRERRHAMGKCHWAEGGFTRRSAIGEPAKTLTNRPLVLERQLHEQVVRVLSIVNGVAIAQLTCGEQIWIATSSDRPRLGAEHRGHAHATVSDLTTRHAHDPVDAAGLVRAAMLLC